jgi:hypothetical protein
MLLLLQNYARQIFFYIVIECRDRIDDILVSIDIIAAMLVHIDDFILDLFDKYLHSVIAILIALCLYLVTLPEKLFVTKLIFRNNYMNIHQIIIFLCAILILIEFINQPPAENMILINKVKSFMQRKLDNFIYF